MPSTSSDRTSAWAVLLVFFRLGLTSFGGPVAHLGYFREEFVQRRRWLSERAYADVVALCQFLPGPASSQVGMALGLERAGYAGALAAWVGFTLPSALALTVLALAMGGAGDGWPLGALHGLKIAAVAVVAQAVWGMARHLCPDVQRVTLMLGAAGAALLWPAAGGQWLALLLAAVVGLLWLRNGVAAGMPSEAAERAPASVGRVPGRLVAIGALCLHAALLLALPLAVLVWPGQKLAVVDTFYRAGALVFGGGHVVMPLLQAEVVPNGWVDHHVFLAGYGAAQAVPGPLFTFAAFLGASIGGGAAGGVWGWAGAALAVSAIFAPSFLLVVGVWPFWQRLRRVPGVQAALAGVNAAVVGWLLAALYDPVWTSAIHQPADFALALTAWVALQHWRSPPWLVVAGCCVLGLWLPPGP